MQSNILYLLEDFSGAGSNEELEIINCSIVPRVSAILQNIALH